MIAETVNFIHELSNRKLAVAIWIIIALIWCLFNKKIRESIFQVIKAFFKWKLTISYLLMFTYIITICYLLKLFGLWNETNLPITILWIVCVAFSMLFDFSKANEPTFFKNSIIKNFKILIIITFLINLYVFNIFTELILVPVFAALGGVSAIADSDKQYEPAKKIIDFILMSFGLFLVCHAIYIAFTDINNLVSLKNFKKFYIPILLSATFLPFIYFVALLAEYEMLFVRLGFFVSDVKVLNYAKFKTIITFNFNLHKLNKWAEHISSSWRFESKNEVDKAIDEFKEANS